MKFSFGGLMANGGNQVWFFADRYDFEIELKRFLNDRHEIFLWSISRAFRYKGEQLKY